MFTVCPKCSLKLVVTAADLRVAQGHVRCGRCSNVFNALVGLSDEAHAELSREERAAAHERPEAPIPQPIEPAEPPNAQAEAPSRGSHESGSAEPVPSESDEAPLADGAFEFDAASTDISEVFIEASPDDLSATGQSETIYLRSEEEPAEHADEGSEKPAGEPADGAYDADEVDGLELSCGEAANLEEAFADQPSDEDVAFAEHSVAQPSGAAVALDDEHSAERPAGEAIEIDEACADERADESNDLDRDSGESHEQLQPLEVEHLLEETDEFEIADLEFLLDSSASGEAAGESASAERQTTSGEIDAPASAVADAHEAQAELAASPTPVAADQPGTSASPPHIGDAATLEEFAPAGPRLRGRWGFAAGSAILALALAAQIVNHYRARLVEVPSLHRPLAALYAALGRPLRPHWNVKAYAVRQLGAIVDPGPPGALSVRASIENTAPRAQPLPLLRVIVQDRFGNRVAARDVRPRAYLPGKNAKVGLLGPGMRVDAEIAFVDPGPRVVGFVIDACLQSEAGRIVCAHEPGAGR